MSRWRRPDAEEVAAFEAFARQHLEPLAVLARGLTSSAAEAQDLLQETLARVLERWEQVSSTRDPYPYTRRVMVNTATSSWRRRRRELHHRSAEDVLDDRGRTGVLLWARDVDADDGTAAHEDRDALLRGLRELPPRQRAVVVLRYLEEMTDAEVAAAMDISTTTVRSTSLRAVRKLEELMAGTEAGAVSGRTSR